MAEKRNRVSTDKQNEASGSLAVASGSKAPAGNTTEHCPLCDGYGRRWILMNPFYSTKPPTLELCCDCEGSGRRPVRSNIEVTRGA